MNQSIGNQYIMILKIEVKSIQSLTEKQKKDKQKNIYIKFMAWRFYVIHIRFDFQ